MGKNREYSEKLLVALTETILIKTFYSVKNLYRVSKYTILEAIKYEIALNLTIFTYPQDRWNFLTSLEAAAYETAVKLTILKIVITHT